MRKALFKNHTQTSAHLRYTFSPVDSRRDSHADSTGKMWATLQQFIFHRANITISWIEFYRERYVR